MESAPSTRATTIKNLYLYLVSFVALMMVVISTADVLNIVLRTYIFTKADATYYPYQTAPCPALPPGSTSSSSEKTLPCPATDALRTQDEENRTAQRQRDLVHDISFIIVGVPLFVYHWRLIRRRDEAEAMK